jgi:Flp pilus assembly protein CpaB
MATGGRSSGRILIVIAILLVVVLAVVAFIFKDQLIAQINPQSAPPPTNSAPQVETIDIVILVQPVPLGGVITKDMVTLFPYPKDKAPEGFFYRNVNDVIGKRARLPLQASIALTTGLLSDSAVGSYMGAQIPPGYVAISVPIDQLTAVSWALQPGDHVSVLVALMLDDLDPSFQSALPNSAGTLYTICLETNGQPKIGTDGKTVLCQKTVSVDPKVIGRTELEATVNQPIYVQPNANDQSQRPRIVSQMLVSDATVLGLGDMTLLAKGPEAANAPVPTPVPGATPTPAPVIDKITLIVTPQDALALNYVMLNKGAKLNLVMRSGQDAKQVKTEAVTLQFLMDQYNIPLPSKLPYGLQPRVDSLNFNSSTHNSSSDKEGQ